MPGQEVDADLGDRMPETPVDPLRDIGVPAVSDRLPALRRRLSAWARAVGMSDSQVEDFVLAADEAMSNAVSHAYDPDRPGTFDLHATHHPERNAVSVTVRDRGCWRAGIADPGAQHGRGLILIRALAHETAVEPSATGTTVRMRWLLS